MYIMDLNKETGNNTTTERSNKRKFLLHKDCTVSTRKEKTI